MQLSTDMRIDDLFKLESIELRLAQSIWLYDMERKNDQLIVYLFCFVLNY